LEISETLIEFPVEIKEKIGIWIHNSRITTTFVTGLKIRLKRTNIVVETPPKVIFKYKDRILAVNYDNDNFHLFNSNQKISFNKLRELVEKDLINS